MINKVFASGNLHSGPRSTTLSEDDTPVTFFELSYHVEGRKKDTSVRKAIIGCVCYGNKSVMLLNDLAKFKSISDGGSFEGLSPYVVVEGSIQSRKIRVTDVKKIRIQEVNVENIWIFSDMPAATEYQKLMQGKEEELQTADA